MKTTGINKAESEFQSKVIEKIVSMGGYVIKIHVSAYQKQGDPDLICCYKGYFVAFELKVGTNKAEPLQQYKINLIKRAGGIAKIVYSIKEVEDTLNEIHRFQFHSES